MWPVAEHSTPWLKKPPWHMLSNTLAGWSGTGEEKDGSDTMRQGLAELCPHALPPYMSETCPAQTHSL